MWLFVLILAIDTSTRNGSVALLRDGILLGEVSRYEETPYSTRLFADLEILKSRSPFQMNQVDVFAVVSGPGSFTGLRIGLTAVKGWAEVHNKPIAAISGLEAICAQSAYAAENPPPAGHFLAPFFDARRGQLFGALYRRSSLDSTGLDLAIEESIFSPEEFIELVKSSSDLGHPRLISPARDLISPEVLHKSLPGIEVEIVSPVLAPTIGRLAFERAKRGKLLDALQLDANYVRRSDAESKWKDS